MPPGQQSRHLFKQPSSNIILHVPVDIPHQVLGSGLHVEVLSLNDSTVTLHHPIKARDLLETTKLSHEDLEQIYSHLQRDLAAAAQDPRPISHTEADFRTAKTSSWTQFFRHLSKDGKIPSLYVTKRAEHTLSQQHYTRVERRRRKIQRVTMGSNIGANIDHVTLPGPYGTFRISHPLIPEDFRVPFADLGPSEQLTVLSELLKVVLRRSIVARLGKQTKQTQAMENARNHTIDSLWEVYREVFELVVKQDVVRYVTERIDCLEVGTNHKISRSGSDTDFFMIPADTAHGVQLGSGSNVEDVSDKATIDGSQAAGSTKEVGSAGSASTPHSWSTAALIPQSDQLDTPSAEDFRSVPDPLSSGHEETAIEGQVEERLLSSKALGMGGHQKKQDPNVAVRDEPPQTSKSSGETPLEANNGAPESSTSKKPSWWNQTQATARDEIADLRAKSPQRPKTFTSGEETLLPDSERKRRKLQKHTSFPSIKNLFRKSKNKKDAIAEVPKIRISDTPTSVTTADTVDDFLHPGGETAEGVHVPANTIAEPSVTVADLFPAHKTKGKEREDIQKSSRDTSPIGDPARIPPIPPLNARVTTPEPNPGYNIQDTSDPGFHPLKQHPVRKHDA